MERFIVRLRPLATILIVLFMVCSSMTMAVGFSDEPMVQDGPPSPEERIMTFRMDVHTNDGAGMDSRDSGRQDFEDEFEVVSPYPTSEDLFDIEWRPSASTALAVGREGMVLEFDGVYFTVVDNDDQHDLWAVGWHPSGTYALVAGNGGVMFRYEGGALIPVSTGTSDQIMSIEFSPDGEMALLVTSSATVYKYDDMTEKVMLMGSFGSINWMDVSWHPYDDTALIAGYEIINNEYGWIFQARVFQYDKAQDEFENLRPAVPQDRDTDLYSVDWSDSGDIALLGGWSGLVMSWDGSAFGTVDSGNRWTAWYGLEFSATGSALLVGTWGSAAIYENGYLTQLDTHVDTILFGVDFSPSGDLAIVVGTEGMILTYDPMDDSFEKESTGTAVTFFDVAWKPDWSYALLVGNQGAIFKYDGKDLEQVSSPTGDNLLGVAWNPSGNNALIVGTNGALLEFFDGGYGDDSLVQRLSGTRETLWDVDFNTFGQALIVGNSGEVREWSGNFATKVLSRTGEDLYAVDWKDSGTAYISGSSGTVLRYRTSPTGHIDLASPSNIFINQPFWDVLWEDTKDRGLLVGGSGTMLEHHENSEATTLDDSYGQLDNEAVFDLYDIDWMYDQDQALVVGDLGTVFLFTDANDGTRDLDPNTNERLNGVDWKANEYALIVGGGGAVMKYWPNLKPSAVVLNNPTQITDNSMKISWSGSGANDFHHYEVHMSEAEDFTMTSYTRIGTIQNIETTDFTVTELTRDTTYYFKVKVQDNAGLSADSNEVYGHTLQGQLPPTAVTLDDPTDITSTAMMLTWTRNRDVDFDHYELHMSTEEGFEVTGNTIKTSIDDQYETEYSAQDLQTNMTYYFKVRVVDEDGLFNDSNEVNGTTEEENYPPDPVTLNEPFNITQTSFEINWTESEASDFLKYEVHMSPEEDFNITIDTRETVIMVRNETGHVFEGLLANSSHYIKVRVFDTAGLNADSNEQSVTTMEYNAPPVAVVLYDPVNITETTITINWSKNNDTDFDKYEVHVSTEADFTPNSTTWVNSISTQNLTSYKVEDLIPGITHSFKIRVYDDVDQFNDSNEVIGKTLGNAPPEAVELEINNVGETQVGLKWTKNQDDDFARYEVHYSTNETFTIDPSTLFDDITSQNTRLITVTGLQPNTTYYFQVRVLDEFNLFNDSNMVNATTIGPNLPPRAVVLGEPQNITRTSMELYWSECLDLDFSYYELHMSENMGFEPTDKTKVLRFNGREQTYHNMTGLDMEEEYFFIIRLYDMSNQHNDSNEVSGKTLPPNQLPIADAGNDQTVYNTQKTQFMGVGVDPDGSIVKYEWDFESDGIWDFENGITGITEHLYTTIGLFVAKFRVTDNDGDTVTDMVNITVIEEPLPNQSPRANAGEDQTITLEETVLFEGTAEDVDGWITLYEWDYDGDGDYDDFSYNDGSGEYTYDDEGIYKAKLRVVDNENATHVDVAIITVDPKNTPPEAEIDKPSSGRKFSTEDFIQFDCSDSYDDDGDSLTYEWTDSMSSGILSTKKKFSKQLKVGSHTITLKVSDGVDEDEDTAKITVEEPENEEPTVKITEPKGNSRVKGIISISGTATDEDGSVTKVCIKIDGGSCQKAQGTRSWFYEWDTSRVKKGSHTIKAIATDDKGDEGEKSISVTVQKVEKKEDESLLPGFEGPVMLAAAAVAGIGLAMRRRRYGF